MRSNSGVLNDSQTNKLLMNRFLCVSVRIGFGSLTTTLVRGGGPGQQSPSQEVDDGSSKHVSRLTWEI